MESGRGWLAGDCPSTGGVLKIARRIWEVGEAGSPVIGRRRRRSQHYWRPGLRASSDGVLYLQRAIAVRFRPAF